MPNESSETYPTIPSATISTDQITTPGSCVMRLKGLEQLSSDAKTALLESIANDIVATILCVVKHREAGNLSFENAQAVNELIRFLNNKTSGRVRDLEKRVDRLRHQRRWIASEYKKLHGSVYEMGQIYHKNAKIWKGQVREARVHEERLQIELDTLRGQAKSHPQELPSSLLGL